jgi:hypothetical protein
MAPTRFLTRTIVDLEKLRVRFYSFEESMLDTPDDGKPDQGRDVLLAALPVIASFESKRRAVLARVATKGMKE